MTLPRFFLAGGLRYGGYYEILNGQADAIYERSLALFEQLNPAHSQMASVDSEIETERDLHREVSHRIDRISLKLDPEHPAFKSGEDLKVTFKVDVSD